MPELVLKNKNYSCNWMLWKKQVVQKAKFL